jgi:hypothetical protein
MPDGSGSDCDPARRHPLFTSVGDSSLVSDDLRRAGDGQEPVRFLNDKFVVDDAEHRGPSWVTLLLSALAAVAVLAVEFVFFIGVMLANLAPCGVEVSDRPSVGLMVSAVVTTLAALFIPVLVSGTRRSIGWIVGSVAASIPFMFVLAGVWAWITPETFTPSTLFCW